MQIKRILIWSLINNEFHPALTAEEKQILAFMPIIKALFPGINYYSTSGFYAVRNNYVVKVLKKVFPEIENQAHDEISKEETLELKEFLPSEGYQWQNDPEWDKKFNSLMVA